MIKRVKTNLEEIESMLYFWQATNDREKVSETYLHEIASLPGLSLEYDEEFNAESVRKVLSAITNRELLSQKTKKEGRFWNNNMWMMEDLSFTDMMIKPIKKLNLDDFVDKLNDIQGNDKYDEIEVRFSPLHVDDYLIKNNMLVINFFKVMPSMTDESSSIDGSASIDGRDIKDYIYDKIVELISK